LRCDLYRAASSAPTNARNGIDNHSHLRLNQSQARKALKPMYVCICNAITDKQIRKAAEAGVHDLWGLQKELGVASNCGSCKEMAVEILRETKTLAQPRIYTPAAA
jgi:bacterioferritin-associated ferredoxin